MYNSYFSLGNLQIRELGRVAWETNLMDHSVFKKDTCFKPQQIEKPTSRTKHTCF